MAAKLINDSEAIVSPLAARSAREAAPLRRTLSDRGRPAGRYDGRTGDTRTPSGGIAATKKRFTDATVGAVEDPYGNGRERVAVAINRRVDVLEMERSHSRISESAYRTGRIVQAVFERVGNLGSTNWMGVSRQDQVIAHELRVLRSITTAEEVTKIMGRIQNRIGMIDTRLLRRILGDRWSFEQCADFEGKGGERGERYVAARFRDALEDLAEGWTGRGSIVQAPDDKHLEATTTMYERQVRSVEGGASHARRQREQAEEAEKRQRPKRS